MRGGGSAGGGAEVAAAAPFRNMITPGGLSDVGCDDQLRARRLGDGSPRLSLRGRRPDDRPPLAADPRIVPKSWPRVRLDAAGFAGFEPDACLVNRYEPGTRLSLHRDENERDLTAPIVSVSLGLPAVFLFGGMSRGDRPRRIRAGERRRRRLGWPGAPDLPWRRTAGRWRASAHRPMPHQPDASQAL